MKKIFVDTENIQNLQGYCRLEDLDLNRADEIILFFSQNTKSVKVEVLNFLLSLGCKIKSEVIEVKGANSLDFHIITNLAVKHSKRNEYYILSNDKGYDSSVEQFKLLGYNNVHRLQWIQEDNNQEESNKQKIIELEVKRIYKLSKDKADFHNKLCKEFGKEGQLIYKNFKSNQL